ncbi:uncharacterized protein LOC125862893 [Solanum stenotomum]|uniref:uncharacterized protein LOC125862893 n=1 Tax=Solanum stenotomum TaxID=172797 RepID=UPI0020D0DBD2|nr:uncharacterized protein LOC125862893 [Solanum stenotomum]
MAPKKEAKKESSSTSTHQPAIGTRTSSRTAKPNLDSNSDPQQPPVNVAPSSSGSGKAKLGSNPKPPRSKKAETKNSDGGGGESSSMGFKKKANSGPAAIGTQSSARQRGKGKVESDPKPPKSKKVETKISDGGGGESSSMDSKKKANSGPAAIGTRSSTRQRGKDKVGSSMPSDSVSQPPKSEKAETNTSGGGGGGGESSSMDSKNKASTETAAIVTQRSTRQQRGKGKVYSNVPTDSVSQPPKSKKGKTTNTTAAGASSPATATAARRRNEIAKSPVAQIPIISPNTRSSSTKISRTSSYEGNARVSGSAKKRLNMEPSSSSGRRDKGKAKMVPSEESPSEDNAPEDMKDKNYPSMFKPVSITSSEANAVLAKRLPLKKRAVVLPTSSVLTRQGKARMANPQPPKSTASTASSARRRKPKTDSDSTPPADPQPPKSEKTKATPSTSVSTRRGKAQMGTGLTPKGRASISRGKTEMGSNPTPPSSSTSWNSSVSATPRNKTTVEPSSRVLRSENLVVLNTSTIAAIITSLGGPAAAVGIIRLSGLSAVPIVGRVVHPKVKKKKRSSSDWRPRIHVVEYGSDSHVNVIDEV